MSSTVMVTGGCGFIGSHQAVNLLEAGHEVVLVDDLSNAGSSVVQRIATLGGRTPPFHRLDVRHTSALAELISRYQVDAIIHLAGRKHVAESVEEPIGYFDVNVRGLVSVIEAAEHAGVRRLIFSSSGSVYGAASVFPIPETEPFRPTNPYSTTKAVCEQLLSSLCAADPRWSIISLRYFNPSGAHPSGLIGEESTIVSNIVPVLMEVAAGARQHVTVHGMDLATPDGSAVRDYIHVVDVAEAHTRAIELLPTSPGYEALNIGRGVGVSVLELIAATERVVGCRLPVVPSAPRPGDVPVLYGDTRRADQRLGQYASRHIDDICRDAWHFSTLHRSSGSGGDLIRR